MGSKNRIFLGLIPIFVLHRIRNTFANKELYVNDKIAEKIEHKHSDVKIYLNEEKFNNILENTICVYFDKKENIYNCLSKIDNKFVIYGIVPKNIRNELTTLFYTNIKQIKKKFQNDKNLRIIKNEELTTN